MTAGIREESRFQLCDSDAREALKYIEDKHREEREGKEAEGAGQMSKANVISSVIKDRRWGRRVRTEDGTGGRVGNHFFDKITQSREEKLARRIIRRLQWRWEWEGGGGGRNWMRAKGTLRGRFTTSVTSKRQVELLADDCDRA